MNLRHSDAKSKYFLICLFAVSRNLGSVWISKENRPEYWTVQWRIYYADGEPNFSGKCLYLSKSWLVKSLHIKKGKKGTKNVVFFQKFNFFTGIFYGETLDALEKSLLYVRLKIVSTLRMKIWKSQMMLLILKVKTFCYF